MNRYAYTGYDPVNYVDPSGFFMDFSGWFSGLFGSGGGDSTPQSLGFSDSSTFYTAYQQHAVTHASSSLAGIGCGMVGGPILSGTCSGLVSGMVGSAFAGGTASEILSGGYRGALMGLASGTIGYGVGTLVAGGFSGSPLTAHLLGSLAETGAGIGLQAARGEEINWGYESVMAANGLFTAALQGMEEIRTNQLRAEAAGRTAGRSSEMTSYAEWERRQKTAFLFLAAIPALKVSGGTLLTWAGVSIGGAVVIHQATKSVSDVQPDFGGPNIFSKSRKSGKERASDIPSWAQGQRPRAGENGKNFADRLLSDKYGNNNYPKGPGSEWNKRRPRRSLVELAE